MDNEGKKNNELGIDYSSLMALIKDAVDSSLQPVKDEISKIHERLDKQDEFMGKEFEEIDKRFEQQKKESDARFGKQNEFINQKFLDVDERFKEGKKESDFRFNEIETILKFSNPCGATQQAASNCCSGSPGFMDQGLRLRRFYES